MSVSPPAAQRVKDPLSLNLGDSVPAALIAALAPTGTLAFVALIVWRLFPGGVPGTLTAWTQYRTTTTARTKALDPDERTSRIGMEMLRLAYGTGAGPDPQTAPAAPEQPPASPGDPPP